MYSIVIYKDLSEESDVKSHLKQEIYKIYLRFASIGAINWI